MTVKRFDITQRLLLRKINISLPLTILGSDAGVDDVTRSLTDLETGAGGAGVEVSFLEMDKIADDVDTLLETGFGGGGGG